MLLSLLCWLGAGDRKGGPRAHHMHADRVPEGHPTGNAVAACVWHAGKDPHSHSSRKQEGFRGVS